MIQEPQDGNTVYEVAVYNKKVRALVKENRSHTFFSDSWADEQVQGVAARDEDEARELIAQRFPPSDGFVVTAVQPAKIEAQFHV